jgi:hypothetical protein
VTLKYARDEKRDRDRDAHGGDRAPRRSERDDRDRDSRTKNDWLCDAVRMLPILIYLNYQWKSQHFILHVNKLLCLHFHVHRL